MDVKQTITCDGGLFGARALAQMLSEEGVRVVEGTRPPKSNGGGLTTQPMFSRSSWRW